MKHLYGKRLLLSAAVALTLCISRTCLQAAEPGGITPDMAFEFAVVLQGQSTGSISSTASAPFDLTNVGILSIGNERLTASISMTSEQTGIWWIALAGLGKTMDADFSFGVAPIPGQTAQIAVDPNMGLALVTGGVFTITPVTEEEPLTYTITVNGG